MIDDNKIEVEVYDVKGNSILSFITENRLLLLLGAWFFLAMGILFKNYIFMYILMFFSVLLVINLFYRVKDEF